MKKNYGEICYFKEEKYVSYNYNSLLETITHKPYIFTLISDYPHIHYCIDNIKKIY